MSAYPKIAVPCMNGLTFIYRDHILYATSQGNRSVLYTKDGRRIAIHKKLKEVLQLLSDESFIRVHHSHIINLKHITLFQSKNNNIEMSDGTALAISRSRRNEFLERFTKL